jgi:phage-related protein
MAEFTWIPDFGSAKQVKPAVAMIQFGDGYSQRATKGINTIAKNWDVRFSMRDTEEALEIDEFLEARGGVESFDWTPPNESEAGKYICLEWSRVPENSQMNTITARFLEVFEP